MNDNINIYKEFLRGDPQGVNAISLVYWEPLILYGQKFLSRRDVVEDAVAETFAVLCSKAGTFNDETHIKKFLHSTVRNICWNEARKLRQLAQLPETADLVDPNASESIDIKESTVHSEWVLRVITTQLKKLPDQQRHDFHAHFFDLKSFEAIARERGVAVDTVRQNVNHALKALRKYLKDKGHTEYLKKVGFFFSKNIGS
jgi:RNA polymerase sigma factor (sigma-70 family)